jgi:hypothetical protein
MGGIIFNLHFVFFKRANLLSGLSFSSGKRSIFRTFYLFIVKNDIFFEIGKDRKD